MPTTGADIFGKSRFFTETGLEVVKVEDELKVQVETTGLTAADAVSAYLEACSK